MVTIKKKELTIGAIKNKFVRVGAYLGMINLFLLIGNLAISLELKLSLTLFIMFGAFCSLLVVSVIDAMVVLPSEQEYTMQKNPLWMDMYERLKKIEDKLNEK